jgi:hypothetical protein
VEVTRARLAGEGFDATVVVGEAQALPFADESFGVVLSVFAAIFAPSAEEAIGDILSACSAPAAARLSPRGFRPGRSTR